MNLKEIWIEYNGDPNIDDIARRRFVSGVLIKPEHHSQEIVHFREVNPAIDAAYAECERALEMVESRFPIVTGSHARCCQALTALRKARDEI